MVNDLNNSNLHLVGADSICGGDFANDSICGGEGAMLVWSGADSISAHADSISGGDFANDSIHGGVNEREISVDDLLDSIFL